MWTPGDISGSQTLTPQDHLYETHINELRTASDASNLYFQNLINQINQDIINAKTPIATFGVSKGDFRVDNYPSATIALQAALDYVKSVGGGVLQILPGTFILNTTIIVYSNITIRGSGRDVTVFKLANAANCHIFRNENWTQGTLADKNIAFTDLTIDGNGANQTQAVDNNRQNGIIFKSTQTMLLQNIEFKEINGFNINTDRVVSGDSASYPDRLRIVNCSFSKSSACLYFWDLVAIGCTNASVEDCTFDSTLPLNNALTFPYVKSIRVVNMQANVPNRSFSIETAAGLTSSNIRLTNPTFVGNSNSMYLSNVDDLSITTGSIDAIAGYCISCVNSCTNIRGTDVKFSTSVSWLNLNTGTSDVKFNQCKFTSRVGSSDGVIVRANVSDVAITNSFMDASNSTKAIALLAGVSNISTRGTKVIATGHSAIYLGGNAGDVIDNIDASNMTVVGAKFGAIYGPSTVTNSRFVSIRGSGWEQTSPGSYGFFRAVFQNCVFGLNVLTNTGVGNGIVELAGSSNNRYLGNQISGVTTQYTYASGSNPVIETRYVPVPATATSTGLVGDVAYDASYYYVCTATNTWKRTPITTW